MPGRPARPQQSLRPPRQVPRCMQRRRMMLAGRLGMRHRKWTQPQSVRLLGKGQQAAMQQPVPRHHMRQGRPCLRVLTWKPS